MNSIIPVPRCSVSIRPATLADVPFIDGLQKANSKMVGWMPQKQLEGKIGAGHVLVAEQRVESSGEKVEKSGLLTPLNSLLSPAQPVGYCIGTDRYFKRDDVGIIYQMNVVPGHRRKLVGATLIKALFERAAYGCKLFCCWCAQDIEANRFWESLGFIPLAFRAGSREKGRVHIFWQRRIREGDCVTPYWFPAKTDAGAIREDRLVLPIPPGVKWSDEMPILLPTAGVLTAGVPEAQKALPDENRARTKKPVARKPITLSPARLWFSSSATPADKKVGREKAKRVKVKADPKHVAAARELRDRYLEQFNAGRVLPGGKYEVTRQIESGAKASRPLLENAPMSAEAA